MSQIANKCYVGLDISQDFIDVCLLPEKHDFRITNDQSGFESLIKLLPQRVERIVMEHTSIYGRGILKALQAKHYPVCPMNPRQIRRFAQALGLLAKTDKVDAWICAEFACKMEITPAKPIDPQRQKLADLESTRKQFVDDIVRYKNRMHSSDQSVQKLHLAIIRQMEKQLKKVNDQMNALIQANQEWKKIMELLKSVKGVGQITAHMLLAKLPELGTLSNGAVAALVGVAPYNCDSGYYRGRRKIQGGRKSIRDAMYMV